MNTHLNLSEAPLLPQTSIDFSNHRGAGATNLFIGAVRDNTQGRKVDHLEYEAYEPMALKELEKICNEAREQWPLEQIAIEHRTGHLNIGDIAIVIAVSAPHRAEAFAGCRFLIEEIKQRVPIWKKECFVDGEEWVSARP